MSHRIDPSIQIRNESHFGDRVVRCFAQRHTSLWDLFYDAVRRSPAAEALIDGDSRWTYAQLEREAARVAAGLHASGVAPGDRVAMLVGNRPEFVHAFLGILRAGAIAVPMGTRLQTPEIEYILQHCGAAMLVHDAALFDRLPASADVPALRHCVTEAPRADPELPQLAVQEEDTAVVLYTSGTTGKPKGAMLTHLNIVHSAMHFQVCMQLQDGERSLLAVPASHVTGLVAVLVTMWQVAGATVLMPEFRASEFIRLAARERITHTLMVPAMYNLCLLQPDLSQHDLGAWRAGGFGGAPMPEATIAELARQLPALCLMNTYGATETTSPATQLPAHLTAQRPDSVGFAMPCVELMVVDSHGKELPAGETGEIWIRGPMVVPGYWDNAQASRDSFTAGFWHSGDIGSIDAQGFVRVLDRIKDMINRGGYKIFSVEVENVLSDHPGVLESAIIGRPCPVLGERVHAFISRLDRTLSSAQLREFCAARLADYKVPETFTLLDEPLPRNANGKLLKRSLRDQTPAESS